MEQKTNAAVQAYIQDEHHTCSTCSKHIHQPLCPCCLGKSIKEWCKDFPHVQHKVTTHVNHYLEKTKKANGIRCVKCHTKKVHTCPYCFTEYVHQIIKETGAGVRIISQFLFMFNFDFERKGYAQELAVYGGY